MLSLPTRDALSDFVRSPYTALGIIGVALAAAPLLRRQYALQNTRALKLTALASWDSVLLSVLEEHENCTVFCARKEMDDDDGGVMASGSNDEDEDEDDHDAQQEEQEEEEEHRDYIGLTLELSMSNLAALSFATSAFTKAKSSIGVYAAVRNVKVPLFDAGGGVLDDGDDHEDDGHGDDDEIAHTKLRYETRNVAVPLSIAVVVPGLHPVATSEGGESDSHHQHQHHPQSHRIAVVSSDFLKQIEISEVVRQLSYVLRYLAAAPAAPTTTSVDRSTCRDVITFAAAVFAVQFAPAAALPSTAAAPNAAADAAAAGDIRAMCQMADLFGSLVHSHFRELYDCDVNKMPIIATAQRRFSLVELFQRGTFVYASPSSASSSSSSWLASLVGYDAKSPAAFGVVSTTSWPSADAPVSSSSSLSMWALLRLAGGLSFSALRSTVVFLSFAAADFLPVVGQLRMLRRAREFVPLRVLATHVTVQIFLAGWSGIEGVEQDVADTRGGAVIDREEDKEEETTTTANGSNNTSNKSSTFWDGVRRHTLKTGTVSSVAAVVANGSNHQAATIVGRRLFLTSATADWARGGIPEHFEKSLKALSKVPSILETVGFAVASASENLFVASLLFRYPKWLAAYVALKRTMGVAYELLIVNIGGIALYSWMSDEVARRAQNRLEKALQRMSSSSSSEDDTNMMMMVTFDPTFAQPLAIRMTAPDAEADEDGDGDDDDDELGDDEEEADEEIASSSAKSSNQQQRRSNRNGVDGDGIDDTDSEADSDMADDNANVLNPMSFQWSYPVAVASSEAATHFRTTRRPTLGLALLACAVAATSEDDESSKPSAAAPHLSSLLLHRHAETERSPPHAILRWPSTPLHVNDALAPLIRELHPSLAKIHDDVAAFLRAKKLSDEQRLPEDGLERNSNNNEIKINESNNATRYVIGRKHSVAPTTTRAEALFHTHKFRALRTAGFEVETIAAAAPVLLGHTMMLVCNNHPFNDSGGGGGQLTWGIVDGMQDAAFALLRGSRLVPRGDMAVIECACSATNDDALMSSAARNEGGSFTGGADDYAVENVYRYGLSYDDANEHLVFGDDSDSDESGDEDGDGNEEQPQEADSEGDVEARKALRKFRMTRSIDRPALLDSVEALLKSAASSTSSASSAWEWEFRNVSFAYPSDPSTLVLRDVSFAIPAHAFAGVVGPSGSGKTTLLALMLRVFDPTRGEIRLNGVALTQISPRWLRRHLAYVGPLCPLLLSEEGYATDQVAAGAPLAAAAQVHRALRDACLPERMFAGPTWARQHVATMSGGEAQRVQIARAFLKLGLARAVSDAEASSASEVISLLFDEGTSALDSKTEEQVVRAIDGKCADDDNDVAKRSTSSKKTSRICVAHRLFTVRDCDLLLIIYHGRLLAQGTFLSCLQQAQRALDDAKAAVAAAKANRHRHHQHGRRHHSSKKSNSNSISVLSPLELRGMRWFLESVRAQTLRGETDDIAAALQAAHASVVDREGEGELDDDDYDDAEIAEETEQQQEDGDWVTDDDDDGAEEDEEEGEGGWVTDDDDDDADADADADNGAGPTPAQRQLMMKLRTKLGEGAFQAALRVFAS